MSPSSITIISSHAPLSMVARAILLTLVLLVMSVGCLPATTSTGPLTSTLPVPSLHRLEPADNTRDGITVTVSPVTFDTYRRFPEAHRTVTWSRTVQQDGQSVTVPGHLDTNLFPMPNFQIRIANHTGHVVRFTQTVFRLQDNLGHTYPTMPGTADVVSWNEGVWATATVNAPEILPQVMSQVRAAVGQIQLLTRSTVLLNGDEWSGYLLFNMGVNTTDDYLALLNSVSRFTLRLAEIPVEVNDAGTPTRTTEFDFNFDRSQASVSVTCPDGTAPSLSACTW